MIIIADATQARCAMSDMRDARFCRRCLPARRAAIRRQFAIAAHASSATIFAYADFREVFFARAYMSPLFSFSRHARCFYYLHKRYDIDIAVALRRSYARRAA